MLRQFTYFGLSGLAGTAVHFATLGALVEWVGLGALPASCIGAVGGAVVTYFINYHLTFAATASHRRVASRYGLVVINGWILNAALMAALLYLLPWHYLWLQAIVTLVVMIVNFTLSRQFAFREDDASVN